MPRVRFGAHPKNDRVPIALPGLRADGVLETGSYGVT